MNSLDTVVFESPLVRAAHFRCDARDPRFRDSGPVENCIVVFPRTAVWLTYAGSRPFVADPTLATIYNAGQEYRREPISREGDHCEWLAVSPSIAREISESFDEACDDWDRPFAAASAPVARDLYLSQRAFFTQLERGELSTLEAEETIIGLVSSVIARAYDQLRVKRDDTEWQIDLVERARASLLAKLCDRQSLSDLAAEMQVSPFHLCRVFRKRTGQTLHEYKTDLRLRRALELIGERSHDLSRIAYECGFSSHSHFTAAVRDGYAQVPSLLRKALLQS